MKEYIVTEHPDFPYEEPKPQELIRCKDCKWYYKGGATCMFWDGENSMSGDDYCSRAERRNDERME